jgi:hypothetical protein
MQLIKIDKQRYRRHLNITIAVCIVCLIVGSLGIAQLLIGIFPTQSGSHFHWNFLGVVISTVAIGLVLHCLRSQDFMREVVYVWNLKQALNKINRKMRPLQVAATEGNESALLTLLFSCAGSRLLWQLDDNTLVIDELMTEQARVDSLVNQYNLHLDVNDYTESILDQF